MARQLPEKIDDWTPPWEARGTEFDAKEAKELVFNLMHSEQRLKATKADLTAKLTEAKTDLATAEAQHAAKPKGETEKDQEITTLRTKVAALEKDGRAEDLARIQRLEVAIDHGLTKQDARRLVGDSVEELEEDAAELAERFGVKKGDKESGDAGREDQENRGPASQRPIPNSELGNGRKQGQGPALIKAEDILAGKSPLGDLSGGGLRLAPLTR